MTLEYVQTWMVREGREAEHDRLFREWVLRLAVNPELLDIRFPRLNGVDNRKRVVVYVFEDAAAWARFYSGLGEEFARFVETWSALIDVNSFRIFFRGHEG